MSFDKIWLWISALVTNPKLEFVAWIYALNYLPKLHALKPAGYFGLQAEPLFGFFLFAPVYIRRFKIALGDCRKGVEAFWAAYRQEGSAIEIGSARVTDRSRMMHTHIVGATGSGKTVCMEHILFADLKRGHGALIIDPKGEREFYERVRAYAKKIGREKDLFLLSSTYASESVAWNPCGLGGVSELQTKFFNSAIYSEPHYAKACEAALLRAFDELVKEHPKGFTIEHLTLKLEELAQRMREKNLEGLFYDMFNLTHGEWGQVLGAQGNDGGRPALSLLDVIQQGKILFVDLPTEGKAVQSSRIGRLLTQEIVLISGMRKRHPNLKNGKPFSVFIDEFDAFGTESFISFLNKGRSSGFLITLAHQTLSDLKKISDTFPGQVIGNTDVRFIFRQNDPDDAETWAKIFGTQMAAKRTYAVQFGVTTRDGSERMVQEFKIHPDQIKDQPTGRCIFHVKSENKLMELKIPRPEKLAVERHASSTNLIEMRGFGGKAPEKSGLTSEVPIKAPRKSTKKTKAEPAAVQEDTAYLDLPTI